MARSTKLLLGLALLLLLGAVAFAWSLTRGPGSDRLAGDTKGAAEAETNASVAEAPEERCAAPATYDRLKRELFRQAAATRGADGAVFDRLAPYAALRVSNPVVREEDEGLERVSCTARVTLDLPPGVAVVGGRRSLAANVGYSLQPSADGSGEVLTLSGAESITAPLATLARVQEAGTDTPQPDPAAPPAQPVPEPGPAPSEGQPPFPAPSPAPPPPPPARSGGGARPDGALAPQARPQASANPSFNCAQASNRAERAVCGDAGLASLDRQMANRFFAARREANATQRVLLDRTRGSFLAFRNRCTSDACIAGAYRDRIREINDIMADRWVAPE